MRSQNNAPNSPFQIGWNQALGAAIEALDTPGFPRILGALLSMVAPFQMLNGFRYSRTGNAFDLYNEQAGDKRPAIVDNYLAGAYILDPFYDAVRRNEAPRLLTLTGLAPDDFRQSEYYHRHYCTTGIVDEIGFVLSLADGSVGILSLCRLDAAGPFTKHEIQSFESMSAIICPLAGHHWSSRLPLPRTQVAPPAAIDHASLTPREREIVTLILKGHSSISIAALLSLSPETVKVHRRRIYAKLKISSQAELFRVFLTEHRQAAPEELVGG